MRIAIFGKGWIGTRLRDLLTKSGHDSYLYSSKQAQVMAGHDFDIVVNAAGVTGRPNIDSIESSYANMIEAVRGNVSFAKSIAEWTECKLIHLSSGCLWASGDDITEDARPEPPSWYSQTKAEAEKILAGRRNTVIARLRMPFDSIPHDRNLLGKLAKYDLLLEGQNSLTSLRLLADFIGRNPASGVWNVAHPDGIDNMEIRQMLVAAGMAEPCTATGNAATLRIYGRTKSGRSVCTLSTAKLQSFMPVPPVREALREAIEGLSRAKESK